LLQFKAIPTIGPRCKKLLLKILSGIFLDQGEGAVVSGIAADEIIVKSKKLGCASGAPET
jgi:hypothetical protein